MSDSPGALLRAAREKQGLHIAALAASIKVTPRRLEALEADRYDELLDPTFARALAQTVCRALKIDPAPVLAGLPQGGVQPARLVQVSGGLRTPFRERPGMADGIEWTLLKRPVFWGTAIVLLAAIAVYWVPSQWLRMPASGDGAPASVADEPPAAAPPASDPAAVAADNAGPAAEPAPAAEPVPAAASAAAAASAPSGALRVHAGAPSWLEIRDATGKALVFRTLEPGESVGVDGTPPFKVTVGNAKDAELTFLGQPVDLKPSTRDNVARLELK